MCIGEPSEPCLALMQINGLWLCQADHPFPIDRRPTMARALAHSPRVDATSWALFFIWIGIAILADIGWGWSLLGISAIVLGTQAVVYFNGNKADGFWILCGVMVLAAAVWELFDLTSPLGAVLLVVWGIVMLLNSFFGSARR
jgi:hypothetical protein